jgi:predicted Zn-dependent protease
MFGAVRSAPAAPPPPAGTQIFGARTQIFGKGQIPPAPGSTLPLFPGASPSDPHVRGEQLPRRDSSTRERRRWRGSRWAIAVGSVAFIALGWVGVREWRARSTVLPAEALLAQSEAVNALRRDDAESIAAARAKLETLIQRWPRYLEARASHLSALLFQLDEARMEALRFTREAAEIDAEINVLREQKTPEDWEDRVATLVDRQAEIKAQNDRFADRAARRAAEAQRALKEMPSAVGQELAPGDDIQLARAQALYFGVTGSEQALAVSERYRLLGGQEGWGEVASAAYALNAPVAPETRHQAREALEALRSRDPSWVRLYVMIGRLALEENAPDAAITALESALTLNPKHEVARSLLAQAKRRAKDAAAVSVSP